MNLKTFNLFIFTVLAMFVTGIGNANAQQFTYQDTLRGSITSERAWWDLTYYHLDVQVDIANKSISGTNLVQYKVLKPGNKMQIDLQEPLYISRIEQDGEALTFERDGNAFFISMEGTQEAGQINELKIWYAGTPVVAANPPWDGGFTWTKDSRGKPFVATSNQGIGASIWWPNKDHPYDEPDSMLISVTAPDTLMDVSNGRLRGVDEHPNGTNTWHWFCCWNGTVSHCNGRCGTKIG